jgi:filamentous hemagglutinin family protein
MSVRRTGKRAHRAMRRDLPLVSCIMPTCNRRRFVPEAIRLFLTQDYPKKELVVLDDGEDNIADLIPNHPQIRYLCLDRRHSLGAKRNIACEAARGEIIAHWDDDDWYAPWRLSRQVAKIVRRGADLCGLARMLFFDPTAQWAWEYVYPTGAPSWVYGATFCYRKSIWQRSPFLDNTGCEDNLFIANLAADVRLRALSEPGMFVGLVHSANSSPKRTQDPLWRPQPTERIRRVVRGNWAQAPRRAAGPGAGTGPKPVAAVSTSLGAAAVVAGALSVTVAPASANPKGGQVSAGSATISQTSPSRLDIVQSTDRAAIDWQSFSIAPNEQTNFQQPAASSVTLNRVQPGDPSVIAGKLTANGQVVLINPSGIAFSKGAVVDVNSLVATPTDISNANFMAGNMKFDKPSTDPRASVVNQGTITVAQKGLAALVAPSAKNSGTIQAKLGKVVLGGAQTYTVDFYGDGLISFDVGPKVTTIPTRPDGRPVKSLVSNTGRIDAPGGTVLLTADAAAGIVENVVDVRGRIAARTSGQTPGSVTIDAGPGGAATVSGKIDVSGLKPGQSGGSATVTGGSVNLASTARIDARGNAGGGTVRVGGNFHGAGPQRNATTTSVARGAVIAADAIANGNGGQVAVWSDGTTVFNGKVSAQGGNQGGNGGFVETSGKGTLVVGPTAAVTAAAPKGTAGQWLLDPDSNVDITSTTSNVTCSGFPLVCIPAADSSTLSVGAITSAFATGTNVTVTTSNATGTQAGNLAVDAAIAALCFSPPCSPMLTLSAGAGGGKGAININQPISDSPPSGTSLSLVLNAGGDVTFSNTVNIAGPLTVTAGLNAAGATITQAPAGVLTVAGASAFTNQGAGGTITLNNPANALTGAITLNTTGAGGNASLSNSLATTLGASNLGGDLTLSSSGAITQTGPISAQDLVARTELDAGAEITLTNAGNNIPGNVTLSALNTAGTDRASGAISFTDSTGFTVAAQPENGLNGLEIGVNTTANPVGGIAAVSLQSGGPGPLIVSGAIDSGPGGNIDLAATGTGELSVNGPITSGNSISLVNFGSISIGASITVANTSSASPAVLLQFLSGLGTVSESGAGAITAGSLDVRGAGGVSLGGANSVLTLGAQTNVPAGNSFLFRNNGPLTIANTFEDGVATSGGSLTVVTTGTCAGGCNLTIPSGSSVTSPPSSVTSLGGPITLMAGGHGGTFKNNGIIDSTPVTGAAGNIVILADAMTLLAPTTSPPSGIKAGSATLVLGPVTRTTSTALGTPAPGGSLNLTQSDLDSIISAGMLQVGYRNTNGTPSVTGDINIASPITINTSQVPNLLLVTGGGVTESPGAFIDSTASGPALHLGVIAGGSVAMSQANKAGVVAGFDDGGAANAFVYRNDVAPLTIGTLTIGTPPAPASTIGVDLGVSGIPSSANMTGPAGNPLAGVSTNGAAITVATTGGANLTVASSSVVSDGGAITLMAGGAGATFTNDDVVASTDPSPAVAGNIAIIADAMSLATGRIIAATPGASGTVMVGPFTASDGIALGAVGSAGVLGLAPADLASITAGLLQVGYRNIDGTPSFTGDINVAAPVTINTSQVSNLLLVTGGSVTQSAGATISALPSTSPPSLPLSLGVIARGPVALGEANQVATLAGYVDGAASNSFLYRNDRAGLTVGTSPGSTLGLSFDPTTGIPSSANMAGPATNPLAGVTTAGGSILLETTTSGNLALSQPVNAGSGAVTLTSAGTITEPAGGSITAATLSGNSTGGTTLDQANLVADLGPFTNNGAGGFALTDGQTLNVTGAADAGTGGLALTTTSGNLVVDARLSAGTVVTLSSAGTITEAADGLITTETLTGSSVGGTALNQANQVADLGPFTNTGAGGFALSDGQTLNVTGAVDAGTGGLALTTTSGNLLAGAGLSAGTTVTLSSAGTITEPAGGLIAAATLTGNSTGGTALNRANLLANLGPFTNTGSGGFTLSDGQTLNVTGAVDAGTGGLALTTTNGNLVVGASLSAGTTVTLTSAGMIAEQTGGAIAAELLTGSSVGNASLDQGNLLANLGPFTTTASGTFILTDNQALTVSGPLSTAGDLRIRVNSGDLTLVGNITAGGGSSNAALVATAGNASELDDPVVTASGLIIDAAGNVSFGVNGGKVFPADANAVGTLAGTAGGSFGFLNGPALTVGTVPGTGGVASQSGITASATIAGDVLIQTNNLGQPLTLAGNITAGGRAFLDTAGAFFQTGAVTVTAPVLAVDTTGSGVGTLLRFITSTNVNANVIAGLPPAGKTSNPMQFADLSAPNSVVLLFADQGAITGAMQAGQLGLSGIGSVANLQGSINGVTDPTAALLGIRDPGPAPTYLFNDCIIAAASCFVPSVVLPPELLPVQPQSASVATVLAPAFLVVQPQSASAATVSDLLPDIAAITDFITPEGVTPEGLPPEGLTLTREGLTLTREGLTREGLTREGLPPSGQSQDREAPAARRQSKDPDAPVINIFDEERL